MDIETIEYLHDSGQMPDWIYYQVNGKSAWENYREQRNKQNKAIMKQQIDKELEKYKLQRQAEIDEELEKQIENEVAPEIERVINNLFKDWE